MKRAILITSLLILFIGCKKVEIENEDYEQFKETEMAVLPETNITTAMVGNTLGTSSRNVGELCTHPNINKWSRHKPVRMPLSERLVNPNHWYRGSDGMLGLSVAAVSASSLTYLSTRTNVENISNRRWNLIQPLGSSTSPFCLGDFRGYDKTATPPFDRPDSYYLNTFEQSGSRFQFNCDVDGGSGDNVQLYEMTGINWDNIYLVAVIYDGSIWKYTFQSEEPINGGVPPYGDVTKLGNKSGYDVFLVLWDDVDKKFYPFMGATGPVKFKKEFNNPLTYSNQVISWSSSGVFKTFASVDADDLGNNAPALYSNGTFVYKVRVSNPTAYPIVLKSSDFSFWGTSAFYSTFQNEVVIMKTSSGQQVSSISVSAGGYVDVIFEPLNNILLWNGSSYAGNYQSSNSSAEIGLNYHSDTSQTFLYLVFNYRYTVDNSWV